LALCPSDFEFFSLVVKFVIRSSSKCAATRRINRGSNAPGPSNPKFPHKFVRNALGVLKARMDYWLNVAPFHTRILKMGETTTLEDDPH